jgi:SAM-dependent methyltransferase
MIQDITSPHTIPSHRGPASAGAIRWLADIAGPELLDCPNCGSRIVRRRLLETSDGCGRRLVLLACSACGACFFEKLTVADYAAESPLAPAAIAFYLQQGADTYGMARRLGALGRPLGTRYLEIGCGFGFGLDIARRGLGWEVLGLDPSPFARIGRDLLALPIDSRYLLSQDPLENSFDVVHASEVLEHVPDPLGILRTLRSALRPDGTLLLTTPAAEAIHPETSLGQLVPLLSAGWHMVIQSAASLDMLLRRAGFAEVEVRREGPQLVALAGALSHPGTKDPDDTVYLRWLSAAAGAISAESDLGLGLWARLYRTHIGGSRAEQAEEAWQVLDAAVRTRFSQGIEAWATAGIAPAATLSELAAREPLCLAGVLLHRAWSEMQRGHPAEALLAGAVRAAARLRVVLADIGSDDGDTEAVSFAAERELIVLAAARGDPGIVDRLEALSRAGAGNHVSQAAQRCFVPLVNHGVLADARRLDWVGAQAVQALCETEPVSIEQASKVYCAATLELQLEDGRWEAATGWLRNLRGALIRSFVAGDITPAQTLFWPTADAEALGHRLLGRENLAAAVHRRAKAQAAGLDGFPDAPAA